MPSHYTYILSIQKQKHNDLQWVRLSENAPAAIQKGALQGHMLCRTVGQATLKPHKPLTLTPARNVRRPGEALLEQWNQVAWNEISPESGAAYQLIWTEQKTVSCGRKNMNETLLLVVKILALTSELTDVFVTLLQ
jgi:hypothetical protein